MRIGSVRPSNPRTRSVGRATSSAEADMRSYAPATWRPAIRDAGGQTVPHYAGFHSSRELLANWKRRPLGTYESVEKRVLKAGLERRYEAHCTNQDRSVVTITGTPDRRDFRC